MDWEGDTCLEPETSPLNVPGLCEGGRPPISSLNALALPMQGLPSWRAPRLLLGARMASEGFGLALERVYILRSPVRENRRIS
jgi:hypothetical protein